MSSVYLPNSSLIKGRPANWIFSVFGRKKNKGDDDRRRDLADDLVARDERSQSRSSSAFPSCRRSSCLFMPERFQRIAQHGEDEEVFGTPEGFLALDDPIQLKDSDPQRSQGDLEGILFFFIEAHEPIHGQDDIEQLHRIAGERMNSTFCRFSSMRNAISLLAKIRFSGTEETPLQAVDRLFFEEKKRMTDIVSVHRWVAPGDPVGRLEETERAARFPVGFFEEGRRPDAGRATKTPREPESTWNPLVSC